MQIAGIQKLTLVDFPGHVAATIFTRGCNFRCGFCHNPELVLPEQYNPLLDEKELFEFLEKRYGKLNGVCITGGEPLLQPDIKDFITHMKALGFAVKLDTNGSLPDRLEEIINEGEVDYIAMDVKNSLSKYSQTVLTQNPYLNLRYNSGCPEQGRMGIAQNDNSKLKISGGHSERSEGVEESQSSISAEKSCHPEPTCRPEFISGSVLDSGSQPLITKIQQSIKLIIDSGIDYEFRTTVSHPTHTIEDFKEIGEMLATIKNSPPAGGGDRGGGRERKPLKYYIQNYVNSKQINEGVKYTPFTDEELESAKKIMENFVQEVVIR
jgi:anaerobic ribonucleoside-triphosphate reductase activating protein